MERNNYLFCGGDLDTVLRNALQSITSKVDKIPRDQFMNARPEEVVETIASELTVEPLVLYEDRKELDHWESRIDVSRWPDRNPFGSPGPIYVAGATVSVSIPFTGNPLLWELKPSRWQTVFPQARVSEKGQQNSGNIYIEISQPADEDPERFKQRLDGELSTIRFYLDSQSQQIATYNHNLRNQIIPVVNSRRDRIKKHEGLSDILGIPLARKDGVPPFEPIKMERKLVRPLPPPPKSGYKPEPGITETDYSHILSVIRHEGRTFETTPKTYAVHDEEELRDILLAHLNGHYQGEAAGEAFRKSGKTDIRIEDDSRAAFVAECKIWNGQSKLSESIDQLLGYLTWRDCKASIIVFNKKNAKFSGIIETVPTVFTQHRCYRKQYEVEEPGEWRFDMTSLEDEGRQVRVHVFAFNLYADK